MSNPRSRRSAGRPTAPRARRRTRVPLLVALLGALAAACGPDPGRAPSLDAPPGDTHDPAADTNHDTAPPDATPALPAGTVAAAGRLVPPAGASPLGWRVLNRFGVLTVADPGGMFTLPVAAAGVTLTVAVPPGAAPGDTSLLLDLVAAVPERDAAGPALRLDPLHTAATLTLLHPALADPDAPRAATAFADALAAAPVAALADALAAVFTDDRAPLARPAVRAALAAAVADRAAALTSPWPDRPTSLAPGDDGDLAVRALDPSPLATAARADGPDARFVLAPTAPLAAAIVVAPIAPGGPHARHTAAGDAPSPLALRDRLDLLSLRDDAPAWVALATDAPAATRLLVPTSSRAFAAAAALAPGLGADPVPLAPAGAWLVTATTGALRGPEAERAWRDHPDAASAAWATNLLATALDLLLTAAPDAAPSCLDVPLPLAADAPDAQRDSVLAGTAAAALPGQLGAALAHVRARCLPAADPAAPWLTALMIAALEAAPAAVAAGPLPGPERPLAALRDGLDGHATGRLILLRGEPWAPRVDAVDGAAPGAPRVRPPGASLALAGAHLAGARAECVDPSGRIRASALTASADGTSASLPLPIGLGGELRCTLVHRGGASAPLAVQLAPRLDAIDPSAIDRAATPVAVRFEGDGFAAGAALAVGSLPLVIPPDAAPDAFTLNLDPADLPPGALPIALAAPGAAPTASGLSLTVRDAPVLLGAGPDPLQPGATLALTALRVGLDPETLAVSLDAGAGPAPAPVLSLAADGDLVHVTVATPLFAPMGGVGTVTLTTPAGSASLAIPLASAPARHPRAIAYHAAHPAVRAAHLANALALARGDAQPPGTFWRVDHGLFGGARHCPLDIRPADVAFTPPGCTHPSGVCDDGWQWADTRDPDSWFTVSYPPGRLATGACLPVPGPASWTEVVAPGAVDDTLTTTDPVPLAELGEVSGPGLRLVLSDARGGGLRVVPPLGGGRSDVTLDLVVRSGAGDVVTLDGVTGVHITRLTVEGTPGQCNAGLVLDGARDVRIDALEVRGCLTGVVVRDSDDVRFTAPATLFGATTGARVEGSRDVTLRAHVGWRASTASPGYAVAAGQTDGVVVSGSDRVVVEAPIIVALAGDGVRATDTRDLTVRVRAGFAVAPGGGYAPATTAVDVGVRLGAGVARARIEDSAVLNARDGIVVATSGAVTVARVALGTLPGVAASAQPPGNRGVGLRVAVYGETAGLRLTDVSAARNASAGIRLEATGGELRLARVSSRVDGPAGAAVPNTQACLLSARGVEGLRVLGLDSRGDGSALCVEAVQDLVVDGLVADGARADAVRVASGYAVVLRDVLVRGAAGVGVRVEESAEVVVEGLDVAGAVEAAVDLGGPAAAVGGGGVLALHDATLAADAPGADGVRAAPGGALLALSRVALVGGGGASVRVSGGEALLDEVTAAAGPDGAAGAGVIASAGAVVRAQGLAVDRGGDALQVGDTAAVAIRGPSALASSDGAALRLGGGASAWLDEVELRGGISGTDLGASARLFVRGGRVTGDGSADAVALGLEGCAGPAGGVVDLARVVLEGTISAADCALPLRLAEVEAGGDVALRGGGAAWISHSAVDGHVSVRAGTRLLLDRTLPVGGVYLSDATAGGVQALGGLDLVLAVGVGDLAWRPKATARAVDGDAGADGPWSAEIEAAPPYAQVTLAWRGPVGAAVPLATLWTDSRGRALAQGLPPVAGPGALVAQAALADGSVGPAGASDTADTCHLPDSAPADQAPGLTWFEGEDALSPTGPPSGFSGARGAATSARWIALVHAEVDGPLGDLALVDRALGTRTPLGSLGVDEREPTLAPAGDALAWVAEADGVTTLHYAELPLAGPPVALPDPGAEVRTPHLSAASLYYAMRPSAGGAFALARRDRADLAAAPALVLASAGDLFDPAVSDDGAWLAFTDCPSGESASCRVALRGPGGGLARHGSGDGPCDDREPAFGRSPEGELLLAATRRAWNDGAAPGPARVVTLTRFARARHAYGTPGAAHAPFFVPPLAD